MDWVSWEKKKRPGDITYGAQGWQTLVVLCQLLPCLKFMNILKKLSKLLIALQHFVINSVDSAQGKARSSHNGRDVFNTSLGHQFA